MDATGSIRPIDTPIRWVMPLAWCAVTTVIIAAGLNIPFSGGPGEAGFGYVFVAAGYGPALMQGLALYSLAAALLGIGFMVVPRITRGRISKGLAWSTFMLMAIGGMLMLVVPQVLVMIGQSKGGDALGVARAWSATWLETGQRISLTGVLMGLATFVEAFWSRPHSPASSS